MKIPFQIDIYTSALSHLLPALGCCVLLGSLASCDSQRAAQTHEFTGLAMGSSWSALIHAETLPLSRPRLQAEFESILNRVNSTMSTYAPESELSRINRTDSANWLGISASLLHVLQAAQQLSRLTEGAFDVTAGPLVNLWGFGPEQEFSVPEAAQISLALRHTGHEQLRLDPEASALQKNRRGMFIDLSAIAKGYAVDEMADYLEQLELDNYLVEIGGEIRTRGVNAEQHPWQIGIEQPVVGQRRVQQIIELNDMAMATSGDYRNFFERDGARYSHTIDPRTGLPIIHQLASVTALHPSAMHADAWATALLVSGPEQGFALALKHGLAAYFIVRTEDGFNARHTPAFESHIAQ